MSKEIEIGNIQIENNSKSIGEITVQKETTQVGGVNVPMLKGDTGPIGPQGPQGPQGEDRKSVV